MSICVGCGLCCDGTLFSHLGVHDDSDLGLPLRALGVEIIVEADPPAFALPCPALVDGTCAVYDRQRPRACAAFECALSTAVAVGDCPPEQARAVIAEAKALRDRVRAGRADDLELRRLVADRFWADPG